MLFKLKKKSKDITKTKKMVQLLMSNLMSLKIKTKQNKKHLIRDKEGHHIMKED